MSTQLIERPNTLALVKENNLSESSGFAKVLAGGLTAALVAAGAGMLFDSANVSSESSICRVESISDKSSFLRTFGEEPVTFLSVKYKDHEFPIGISRRNSVE